LVRLVKRRDSSTAIVPLLISKFYSLYKFILSCRAGIVKKGSYLKASYPADIIKQFLYIGVILNWMKRYELTEHTADVGILAWGRDLKEAFANAALGMLSVMVEPEEVAEKDVREVEVEAGDVESLLVGWLNELIYLFDVEHLLFKRFDIKEIDKDRIHALCYGEKIEPSRHHLKTGVKAATYHMLKVERNDLFRVHIILDI